MLETTNILSSKESIKKVLESANKHEKLLSLFLLLLFMVEKLDLLPRIFKLIHTCNYRWAILQISFAVLPTLPAVLDKLKERVQRKLFDRILLPDSVLCFLCWRWIHIEHFISVGCGVPSADQDSEG